MAIDGAVSQTAIEAWDKRWATSEGRADWLEPHPAVVAILPELHARGTKRVLDLGCGVGRHALLLAEHGFDVEAIDGSPAGLAVASETAAARGLPVSLRRGLADALPFPDAGFDYVLSWNVIHHGTLGDLGRRLGEIWRVLRPAGLLQATVLSTRDANYGIGRAIAPDTFVIDQVERKGHPHCYCDAATLVGLLAGFDLLTLSQQLQERRPGSHHWHTSPNAAAESDLRGKSTVWRLVTLGVLGAVVVTLGSGLQNDIYFQVGLLTTVRLAAKNVILIVDFARERFDHGSTPAEAAVHAAKERLRPILMTSFAFISEHCRWPWRPAPAQAPMWPSARRWSAAWSV